MGAPSKFLYKYKLDTDEELSKKERVELLDQIGEYLKFTMLEIIGDKKSPVTGEKFENLSRDYAKKVGHKWSDLQNSGEMLDALDFKLSKDAKSLDIGFFDKEQAAKAYGHTTGMKDHPWLEGITPERKILPMGKETFDSEITDGIDNIIQEFLNARED